MPDEESGNADGQLWRLMPGTIRSGIDHLHRMNVLQAEGCLALAEIIIPLLDEVFVETKIPDLSQPAVELHEPDL